jgi:hypothetical protein
MPAALLTVSAWAADPVSYIVQIIQSGAALFSSLSTEQLVNLMSVFLNAVALLLAVSALSIARAQLVPLRKDIEQYAAERRRNRLINDSRRAPKRVRRVVGFDPRFTNIEWSTLIATRTGRPVNIRMQLSPRYDHFHDAFSKNIGGYRDSVLLIDLLFVPEYLKKGYIAPLSRRNKLDFYELMRIRSDSYGRPISAQMLSMMALMCSDETGTIGALPIWVNSHGKMIPDPLFSEKGRVAAVSSLDQLRKHPDAKQVFAESGIQSFYIIFEFWAHLAYRGCRLFRRDETGKFTSDLLHSPRELKRFAEAVADLATRLRFSNITKDVFKDAKSLDDFKDQNAFGLGHDGDARMIRESVALWKPVFSSELLNKAIPRSSSDEIGIKLIDEIGFKQPFARRIQENTWTYLSALGGYGLAIPQEAKNDKSSIEALKYIFLSNPYMFHNYVTRMLPDEIGDGQGATRLYEFFERHARPRWPFWSSVEVELNKTLFAIFLLLGRSRDASDIDPDGFWKETKTAVRRSPQIRAHLEGFLNNVKSITQNNGWEFSIS